MISYLSITFFSRILKLLDRLIRHNPFELMRPRGSEGSIQAVFVVDVSWFGIELRIGAAMGSIIT